MTCLGNCHSAHWPVEPSVSLRSDITSSRTFSFFQLVCAIVLLCVVSLDSLATDSTEPPRTSDLHGALEYLQHSLILSAEEARLIAAAERQLKLSENSLAFVAIHTVFSQPHDSFTPSSRARTSGSAYRLALELLQKAPFNTRRDWTIEMEPLAAAALERAKSNSAKIKKVAQHFPFTPSGLNAHAMRIQLALSCGQHSLAQAILADLTAQYHDAPVSFDASATLTALRRNLKRQQGTPAASRIAGASELASPKQLSLPWPKPKWKWHEKVWKFPQGISTFAALTQPTHRASLALNSWQPTLTQDAVLLRTPFRVIAFDRANGNVRWSILTDTVGEVTDVETLGETMQFGRSASTDELLRMDDLGTVAATEDFVFFVDHFRKLAEQPGFRQPQFNLRNPLPSEERNGGTRLVAVQLKPRPKIAWTVGDVAPFQYTISAATDSTKTNRLPHDRTVVSRRSETVDAIGDQETEELTAETAFRKQYFTGVPLVHNQMLYLLSADSETVWLNCLTEATGRLLWQVPVTYQNEQQLGLGGGLRLNVNQPIGASLCGIDGDTIICALNTGVAIGVRLADGRFEWATNVRDDEPSDLSGGRSSFLTRPTATERRNFLPLLSDGRMYWSAQQSSEVYCIDAATGRIQWTVSRSVPSGGILEGSDDQYAIGVNGRNLILIGDRHIRALDIANGHQQWATVLPPQTGRATCNKHSCLVPLQDGTIAYVDQTSGRMNIVSQDYLSHQSDGITGTLVADEEFLYSATPLSVTAFPVINAGTDDNSAPPDSMRKARAAILSGDITSATSQLKQIVSAQSSPTELAEAKKLLAAILLRSLAIAKVGIAVPDTEDATQPDENLTEAINLLHTLPLTREQTLRAAVLSGEGTTQHHASAHRELLDLLPDWNARADVSAWSNLSSQQASGIAPFAPQKGSLLAAAEHAILFPDHVGSFDEQLEFAKTLTSHNFHTAAELFLLSVRRNTSAESQIELDRELHAIRNRFRAASRGRRQPQKAIGKFHVEEKLHFFTQNRISELLKATFVRIDAPDWYADRLMFGNQNLFVLNMNNGAVSTPIRLPTSPQKLLANNNVESPALLPLVGQRAVGMVSLVTSDGPSVLWWRRFEREDYDFSPLELGPLGPDFMIVASENQLACLHPLTGNLLWVRNMTTGSRRRGLFGRSIGFAGDDQVVGVFGENMKSCELFRTKDGYSLGIVPLDIPPNTTPIVSGRRILFARDNQLHLVDLLDRKDVLARKDVPKLFRAGTARVISNHRVVMISSDRNIVVLNMQTGKIEINCPIAEQLTEEQLTEERLTGLSAFERDGRLYVLVKNWGNQYSQRSASSRLGDIRLDDGVLFCLDAKTGKQLWHHVSQPCVIPKIYGDPIDVFVKWSWHDPEMGGFQRRLGLQRGTNSAATDRSLTVTIVDANAGTTLAEEHHLSADEPLRCFHDAETATITLESGTSEIKVKYAE